VKLSEVVRLASTEKRAGRKTNGAIDGWPYAMPFLIAHEYCRPRDPKFLQLLKQHDLWEELAGPNAPAIREENEKRRLFRQWQDAGRSSLRLRGKALSLPEAVQVIRKTDYLTNRAEHDRAIRTCEIRVLANIIDTLFLCRKTFFDRDLRTVSLTEAERHSGDSSFAANFFHDARHHLPFYELDPQPTEQALEKAFAAYSTRDITFFTALLILETLKHQPPQWEYCRLPYTESENKEMMMLLAKSKKTGEDFQRLWQNSKGYRRRFAELLAPPAGNDLHAPNYKVQLPAMTTFRRATTGFTLHWLLGITSRKAAYWRKRAKRNYKPIKKSLRQTGVLPDPKPDIEASWQENEVAAIFSEAAERGETAGAPKRRHA
jgi:hypothetical protein